MYRDDGRSLGAEDVTIILKQMAGLLKNMKTYEPTSPVVKKSFDIVFTSLTHFLDQNESLTMLVREDALVHGDRVCYSCSDRSESLAFSMFRDGIRLISFKRGLSAGEVEDFAWAVHEARKADPYQADLVTILWEKELKHIGYRAVDAYLEDKEREKIEELARKCTDPPQAARRDGGVLSPEFVYNELGLSIKPEDSPSPRQPKPVTDAEVRTLIREILQEDETNLLARCSAVCAEIAYTADTDDMFNSVVSLLGRICECHVHSGDFLSACCIVSDLRLLCSEEETSAARRASILDTIARLGERRIIRSVGEQICDLPEPRLEEVFAYLALMTPTAVEPLCDLLAESERKTVRYMLCRSISIVARTDTNCLRRFITDHRWYVVRNVVMIAGMIGTAEVVPMLNTVSSHREPRIRKELARSLGRIKSEASLDILGRLITDQDQDVRLAAIAAIREVGSAQAVGLLESTISEKNFSRKCTAEKKEILVTFGSLGDRTYPLLKSIADGSLEGFDDESRGCAVCGLAETGVPERLEVLRHLSETAEGPVRCAAAEALSMAEIFGDLRECHESGVGAYIG